MATRRGQDSTEDPDDAVEDPEEDPDDPVDMVAFNAWLDSRTAEVSPKSSEVDPLRSSEPKSLSESMSPPSIVPKPSGDSTSQTQSISNHQNMNFVSFCFDPMNPWLHVDRCLPFTAQASGLHKSAL